jgi:hypothetical protein
MRKWWIGSGAAILAAVWCAQWQSEIGPIYPKTTEGRAAPLRSIDLHQPIPDDLVLASPPRLTPTFILVDDGHEVSRLEGYAGDLFFWQLIAGMIERHTGQPLADPASSG